MPLFNSGPFSVLCHTKIPELALEIEAGFVVTC